MSNAYRVAKNRTRRYLIVRQEKKPGRVGNGNGKSKSFTETELVKPN